MLIAAVHFFVIENIMYNRYTNIEKFVNESQLLGKTPRSEKAVI